MSSSVIIILGYGKMLGIFGACMLPIVGALAIITALKQEKNWLSKFIHKTLFN